MKQRIVVTPAGREVYLRLLFAHLRVAKHNNEFDKWVLWMNTNVESDIKYMQELSQKYDWVQLEYLPDGMKANGIFTICEFFKNVQKDAYYLRLDDDVVYVHEKSIGNMFKSLELRNDDVFLTYGLIVNNAVIDALMQKKKYAFTELPQFAFYFRDVNYLKPKIWLEKHTEIIDKYWDCEIELWQPNEMTWDVPEYDVVSINAIAWNGEDFHKNKIIVGIEEENDLAARIPEKIGKHNQVDFSALFSHFAFNIQRRGLSGFKSFLEEIYKQYELIAIDIMRDKFGEDYEEYTGDKNHEFWG